jgi:hypothetical protein
LGTWNGDSHISHLFHDAPLPYEADTTHPLLPSKVHSPNYIFGGAARTDTKEDVTRSSKRFNLPLKDTFIPAIICERGKKARIGRERYGWQCSALHLFRQSAHELRRHVLAIRGASPISTKEKLPPLAKSRCNHPRRINDLRSAPFYHHLTNGITLTQTLLHHGDSVFHE